ncbi:MAG TPA: hypothetical protein VFR84_13605 [Candidatus Angelobacter sp.]|nr:hypothetical protein [Candidatus Angelobacter sp.]
MSRVFSIPKLVVLMGLGAMAVIPAEAQYSDAEPPRWQARGFAGFSIGHTSQEQRPQETQTDQLFPLGDLRLSSDGYLLDPRFLHLNTALDYQRGTNSSDRGDLATGGLNFAIASAFLPKSHVPLRVNYNRTSHGISGLGLNQNDDGSRLDVQWSMLFPRLPHLDLSFQKYDNTVHVPTSVADRNFNEMALGASVSDVWKDWRWTGNFSQSNGTSTGTALVLGLNSNFENSTRTGSFQVTRNFWENKAHLRFENRELWRHDQLSGDGNNRSSEQTDTANFDVQVTPRVSLNAGYAFTQVDFNGTNFSGVLGPGGALVQLLSFSSSVSNAVSGRVDYRPWEWLRFSQDVRTVRTTPLATATESRTSFTDTASTVSADHHWRTFELMGSYTGRFQLTGTTLENSPNSWSNSFMGRVGWGNVQLARLTAVAQDTRLNLVEQIGGFSDDKRLGLEVETRHFRTFHLRASGEYSNVDLLNVSGDTRSKNVSYSLQADHRLFSAWFTASFMDGAGALFPDGLIDRTFLVVPLPISQLLATPLLNRTTHARAVGLIGRLRRNLDLTATWRVEDTQLAQSRQKFNILQGDARYRLGKFTLEGGYSRNLNDVTNVTGVNGNLLAIWYFRIGRDFKIF